MKENRKQYKNVQKIMDYAWSTCLLTQTQLCPKRVEERDPAASWSDWKNETQPIGDQIKTRRHIPVMPRPSAADSTRNDHAHKNWCKTQRPQEAKAACAHC
jgi:hypothetical protein